MDEKKYFSTLLEEMERAYTESSPGRPMEYTYGFMDALAVVRRRVERPGGLDPLKMALGILTCAAFAGASGEKKDKECECCCPN